MDLVVVAVVGLGLVEIISLLCISHRFCFRFALFNVIRVLFFDNFDVARLGRMQRVQ